MLGGGGGDGFLIVYAGRYPRFCAEWAQLLRIGPSGVGLVTTRPPLSPMTAEGGVPGGTGGGAETAEGLYGGGVCRMVGGSSRRAHTW
jgi:hypothetical protein